MNNSYEKVKRFHEVFEHARSETPILLDPDLVSKRAKWMDEEVREFMDAETIHDQADAMIDLMYFALGTLVAMGVKPEPIFNIVHEANMRKVWPDGTVHYNEDGKVIKPDNWYGPEEEIIEELLRQMGPLPGNLRQILDITDPKQEVHASTVLIAAMQNLVKALNGQINSRPVLDEIEAVKKIMMDVFVQIGEGINILGVALEENRRLKNENIQLRQITGKLDVIPDFRFEVGDLVVKNGGDYMFRGTVQGRIVKRGGQIRYAVENDEGILMIYNEQQLQLVPQMS